MDDDPKMKCPYNKSHVLLKSRLQTHLVKCEKAHMQACLQGISNVRPLTKCVLNAVHHVESHELEQHHKCCSNINALVRHTTSVGEGVPIPYNPIELPPSDENWDDIPPVETYDPSINAASKRVLRQVRGVSKSVRKTFNRAERDRIGQFDEESAVAAEGAADRKPVQMNSVEKHAFTDEPLRRPRGKSLAVTNSQLGQGRGRVAAAPTGVASSNSASTTSDENDCCGYNNQRGSSLSAEEEELANATAHLKVEKKDKKNKALQPSSESDSSTRHDNSKRTGSKGGSAKERGKFARKK